MQNLLRTVPDTNILISAEYGNPNSPNKEYFVRWKKGEFQLLYSDDMLSEYILKLRGHGISHEIVSDIIKQILDFGLRIKITRFYFPEYPPDPDDIAFLLCAGNGNATHLITYDRDLLDIKFNYDFKICQTLEFLKELRALTAD